MWLPGLPIHEFVNSAGITLVNLRTVRAVASVLPYMDKSAVLGQMGTYKLKQF